MFKIGEKVICIDNSDFRYRLKLNEEYTVNSIEDFSHNVGLEEVGNAFCFRSNRFATIRTIRLSKLKQLEKCLKKVKK